MSQVGDFITLTKPRVMSLLLVSAVAGAFLGAGSTPSLEVLFAVLLGGALASGGAASLNMAYESELDQRMGRTKNRPVAEGRISARNAVLFGIALNALAFLVLALLTNVLAASLAQKRVIGDLDQLWRDPDPIGTSTTSRPANAAVKDEVDAELLADLTHGLSAPVIVEDAAPGAHAETVYRSEAAVDLLG